MGYHLVRYGLLGHVGRFSAVTGPLIWAVVTSLAQRPPFKLSILQAEGVAVLVLLGMIACSYIILGPVSDAPRDWEALERDPGLSGGALNAGLAENAAEPVQPAPSPPVSAEPPRQAEPSCESLRRPPCHV